MIKNIFYSILTFSILIFLASFTVDNDIKIYPNIKLEGISIHFDSLKLLILKESYKDSSIFDIDLGEDVEKQTFEIIAEQTNLKVYQKFETSLAISNEGGHLDLLNWKHQQSNWIELKPKNGIKYETLKFPKNLETQFPTFTNQELIKEIQRLSSDEGVNCTYCLLAKNVKKANDYPAYFGVSKVELKFEYQQANKLQTKYIIFYLPMGC